MASYIRWVYFRKKAADGPFDLYSNMDFKIKYYKNIRSFRTVLAVMELTIGFANVFLGVINSLNFYPGIIHHKSAVYRRIYGKTYKKIL